MAYRSVSEGDRVGEYVLEEKLGEGSGTEVWRGRHHVFGSLARVKVALTEAAARALNAAGVLQYSLRHQRSLAVLGLNLDADPPYFLTEFAEGETLRSLLDREGRLDWARVSSILSDVLDCLGALHEKGKIHGNLKPSNVLIDALGRARLTDPGRVEEPPGDGGLLSGVLDEEEASPPSSHWAPPPGSAEGPAADIWGAGVILFEALSGRHPEGAENPSDLVEGLPSLADEVYRRACTRSEGRFASAAEMSTALSGEAPAAKLLPPSGAGGDGEDLPAPDPVSPAESTPPPDALPDPDAVTVLTSGARCLSCGKPNRVEYRHCIHCGAPLAAKKGAATACGRCGKPRHSNYRFCPYCGGSYGNS